MGANGLGAPAPVRWIDDQRLDVSGTRFISAGFQDASNTDQLLILKPPEVVRRLIDLLHTEQPRRILELGVKDGGSTGLLALVGRPEVLVAVDLKVEPPPRLVELIAAHGLESQVVTRFGMDQADRSALVSVVDEACAGKPLDLVIDDASHILGPTRASFDALFPKLRPGGIYIIEDWSADHLTAEVLARTISVDAPNFAAQLSKVRSLFAVLNSPTGEVPPAVVASLTVAAADAPSQGDASSVDGSGPLLRRIAEVASLADLSCIPDPPRPLVDISVELLMAAAGSTGAIAQLQVDKDWILVRRGPAALDPDRFRLQDLAADYFGYLPPR